MRPTISLPPELLPFIEERRNQPQHAGNLSSYIRSLIIADRTNVLGATPVPVRVVELPQ